MSVSCCMTDVHLFDINHSPVQSERSDSINSLHLSFFPTYRGQSNYLLIAMTVFVTMLFVFTFTLWVLLIYDFIVLLK